MKSNSAQSEKNTKMYNLELLKTSLSRHIRKSISNAVYKFQTAFQNNDQSTLVILTQRNLLASPFKKPLYNPKRHFKFLLAFVKKPAFFTKLFFC